MAHSIRAVLGYWCVSATGSLRDRDARLANPAFLQTNADDFGGARRERVSFERSQQNAKSLDHCCDQHSEKNGNLDSPHIGRSKRCGDPIEQPPLPKAVGQFSRRYTSAICWMSSPMGEAVVELKDRKPVGIVRVVFSYLYFDHQGRLYRDKLMKDGALIMEAGAGSTAPAKSGSVIHASRFYRTS
jgi:hypothetical protein